MIHLFVYGTLRQGEANHHHLAAAGFLGFAHTQPTFDLVDLGGYPGMIPGGCTQVAGELYAVGEATVVALDALEEHPHYYQRTEIHLADSRAVSCYLFPRALAAGAPLIPSGDWRRRP